MLRFGMKTPHSRAWFRAALFAAFLAAPHARADGEDEAHQEFQKGLEAVKADNCAEAIPHFRASLRKKPGVGARMNLADCYSRTNDAHGLAEAYVQYQAAAQLAITNKDTERAERAQKFGDELGLKVARYHFSHLPPNTVKVTIDGTELDPSDFPLLTNYALEPNKPHTIEVDGATPELHFAQGLEAQAAGKVVEVTIQWPQTAPTDDPGKGRRLLGMIVGGVGVAGLVAGAVSGVVALSAAKQARDTCNQMIGNVTYGPYPNNCATGDPKSVQNGVPTHGDVDQWNDKARSNATASTIGFIAGGVLLAGGAALYLTAPSAPSTAAANLRLIPAVAPGHAGLAFTGGW
jgi:hypothetical protein